MRTITGAVLALALGAMLAASPAHATDCRTITEQDNGATIIVYVGEPVQLVLHNTWWDWRQLQPTQTVFSSSWWGYFTDSNRAALTPDSAPVASGMPGPVAGEVFGTTTVTFKANAPGTVVLTAKSGTKPVCGTAVACPRWVRLNRYSVTVVVRAPHPVPISYPPTK